MSKIDWDNAPEWADRVMISLTKQYFCNAAKFVEVGKESCAPALFGLDSGLWIGDLQVDQVRPMKGGESVVSQRSSQPHYKDDKDGLDHIARFARDNSIEEFRAAMRFTIDKYRDRLGEKDVRSKELGKIADYYGRWAEVELELEQS